jgi:hypothetical protein
MANRAKSLKIKRRIFGLYIVKRNGRFHQTYQVTPLETALKDIVNAANAVDATQTHPGDVMTRERALDMLCKILNSDDYRTRATPGTLLRIPLSLEERHITYKGKIAEIDEEKLRLPYALFDDLQKYIREIEGTGTLPTDLNVVAVVHDRGTSSVLKTSRSKTTKILLSTWEPVNPRLSLEAACEIHRVHLILSKPIFEYYIGRNQSNY